MPDMSAIRKYALEHKQGSAFASLMVVEKDEISESDFKSRLPVWFALLSLEESQSTR